MGIAHGWSRCPLVFMSGGGDRDNQPAGQQERSVSAVHQAGRHPSQQGAEAVPCDQHLRIPISIHCSENIQPLLWLKILQRDCLRDCWKEIWCVSKTPLCL